MKQRSFDSETLNSPILGGGGILRSGTVVGKKKTCNVRRVHQL